MAKQVRDMDIVLSIALTRRTSSERKRGIGEALKREVSLKIDSVGVSHKFKKTREQFLHDLRFICVG